MVSNTPGPFPSPRLPFEFRNTSKINFIHYEIEIPDRNFTNSYSTGGCSRNISTKSHIGLRSMLSVNHDIPFK